MAATKSIPNFHRYLVTILVSGLILAITIFLGIVPLIKAGDRPAYLDIFVIPNTATVEISGQTYKNAVYELDPGDYTATVRLDNLPAETINLHLEKAKTLGIYLLWTEQNGWQYLSTEDLKHHQAITEIMPLNVFACGTPAKRTNCDSITVKYGSSPNCKYDKCLLITGRQSTLSSTLLTELKNKLSENGYNLDDYQYLYHQVDL